MKTTKIYTADKPHSPVTLEKFAVMAREYRRSRQNPSQVVTVRLKKDIISKYKALGKGYTSIMADVLSYVVINPKILAEATGYMAKIYENPTTWDDISNSLRNNKKNKTKETDTAKLEDIRKKILNHLDNMQKKNVKKAKKPKKNR